MSSKTDNPSDPMCLDVEALLREHELFENPLTEKQRDILRAAERLFAAQGFEGTPTATIAKEAGVTEKTLFKHFPKKVDLLKRVLFPLLMRTVMPLQMRKVRAMFEEAYPSYRAMVEAFALDRWTMAEEMGPRLKLVVGKLISDDQLRADFAALWRKHLWAVMVGRIESFQKAGELRDDVPAEVIARVQVMLVGGHALLRGIIAPEAPFDAAAQARLLATVLFEGVGRVGRGGAKPKAAKP